MTAAAGFDDLVTLINAAWQASPVTEDVTYTGSSGAETIRAEVTRDYVSEAEVSDEAIICTVLRADVDASGSLFTDTVAFGGATYSIIEAREQPNLRLDLLLNRSA